MTFKPTYLYIKQHTVTRLLYFGKTTRTHHTMLTYSGSGHYWNRHLNKHGKEFVDTLWYCLFCDKDELVKFATSFSTIHNIVKSAPTGRKTWANIKYENGLDGGFDSIWLGKKQSEEHKRKRIEKLTGKKDHHTWVLKLVQQGVKKWQMVLW